MRSMDTFDFDGPAEVYTQIGRNPRNSKVEYRRFQSGRDAVRHVMEGLPAEKIKGTVIETEASRYDAEAIRALYAAPGFSLRS